MERQKKIIKTSILGIVMNVTLVAFKATIGFLSNSIAIILDALNNLTDAISSIVTILGTKLANKAPDKKHPYGYGRIEYFSSIVVAGLVLYAGVTAVTESIDKIINPGEVDYSFVSLVIIAVAVLVKFFFGRYVKSVGKKYNSGALVASGQDAFMDSILSFSTLVAAVISFIWGIHLEGYLGVVLAAFIIKAAIDMLIEPINLMIGTRADKNLTSKIRKLAMSYPEVEGVYDLTIHDYGPNKAIATLHIQIPDKTTAREIHRLSRQISYDIFNKYGIVTTVGVYAANISGKYGEIKTDVEKIVKKRKEIKQVHGFYVDNNNNVYFDLVINFEAENPEAITKEVISELKLKYPKYDFHIIIDADISD